MSDGGQSAQARYLRIANHVREQIHSGQLQPGDMVPSTREIVATWGVARQTAERALGTLRAEGLITAAADGEGTHVAPGAAAGLITIAVDEPAGLRVASAQISRATRTVADELGVPPGSAVIVVRLERHPEGPQPG